MIPLFSSLLSGYFISTKHACRYAYAKVHLAEQVKLKFAQLDLVFKAIPYRLRNSCHVMVCPDVSYELQHLTNLPIDSRSFEQLQQGAP